jgi:hypothetical protein
MIKLSLRWHTLQEEFFSKGAVLKVVIDKFPPEYMEV